jgi:hypothetical protein
MGGASFGRVTHEFHFAVDLHGPMSMSMSMWVDRHAHPRGIVYEMIQACLLAQQRRRVQRYDQMGAAAATDGEATAAADTLEPDPESDDIAGHATQAAKPDTDYDRAVHIGELKDAANEPNHNYLSGTRVGEASHPGPSDVARQRAYEHAQFDLYSLEQQHQHSSKLQWLIAVDLAHQQLGPDPMVGYAAETWYAAQQTLGYAFLDAQHDVDRWGHGIPDNKALLLFVNGEKWGAGWLHKWDWHWWLEQG